MEWLSKNSAAIQAINSMLALLLTALLATITWQYVKLTRQLAQSAVHQIRAGAAAELAELHELRSHLIVIVMNLVQLPHDVEDAERLIRQAPGWDTLNLSRVQALASRLGEVEGRCAALAVSSLMWLQQQINAVQAKHPHDKNDWEQFPWEVWRSQIDYAQDQLNEIGKKLNDRLKPE